MKLHFSVLSLFLASVSNSQIRATHPSKISGLVCENYVNYTKKASKQDLNIALNQFARDNKSEIYYEMDKNYDKSREKGNRYQGKGNGRRQGRFHFPEPFG